MMCTSFSKQYGCGGCNNFVRSTSIEIDGDTLVIELPNPTRDLVNKQQICICLAQAIPSDITSEQTVIVQLGSTLKATLVTKKGNLVHADQLRSRRVYHTSLATDTEALMVCEKELGRTRFPFPTFPVVPTP